MNIENIIKYIKKIDLYLWIILAVSLGLFIFILVKNITSGSALIVYYVLAIYLINSFLAIYSYSKTNAIPYILGVTSIVVELFAILSIFSKIN